jgi:cell pole-organizing protein PopZ
VLLLTDLVDEPDAAPSSSSRPALVPPASADPVKAAQTTPPAATPALSPVTPLRPGLPTQPPEPTPSFSTARPVASVEPSAKQSSSDHGLVEPGTASLAASAFDRLSRAVEETVPQPVASDPGPSVGPDGRNLEDIVKELLRPMLKEWLDRNLPAMVERFVEREIVRLTRR